MSIYKFHTFEILEFYSSKFKVFDVKNFKKFKEEFKASSNYIFQFYVTKIIDAVFIKKVKFLILA